MIKPITYEPIVQSVEAVQWNSLLGWEFALELAEWCGGEAVRDKNPMNTEKSYYWGISRKTNDKVQGFYATPGDYIIKDVDGRFSILSSSDFENTFKKKIDPTEDPDKARAKRRATKVRRRIIEEGKDPDNGD